MIELDLLGIALDLVWPRAFCEMSLYKQTMQVVISKFKFGRVSLLWKAAIMEYMTGPCGCQFTKGPKGAVISVLRQVLKVSFSRFRVS